MFVKTGVGIQVSDSPPPYCIAVCSVQEPHLHSVNISKLGYEYFFVVLGVFLRSPIFTVFIVDPLSIKIK